MLPWITSSYDPNEIFNNETPGEPAVSSLTTMTLLQVPNTDKPVVEPTTVSIAYKHAMPAANRDVIDGNPGCQCHGVLKRGQEPIN